MRKIITILSIIIALLIGLIIGITIKQPQPQVNTSPQEVAIEDEILEETTPSEVIEPPQQATIETEYTSYDGEYFSFQYPSEYVLTEEENGLVRITSIEPPTDDEREACSKDEIAASACIMSPNIAIQFIPGNAQALWGEYEMYTNDFESDTLTLSGWEYNRNASEWGGARRFGLLLDNGIIFASSYFSDTQPPEDGQFEAMKSDRYQLDQYQQFELIQEILSTLTIN